MFIIIFMFLWLGGKKFNKLMIVIFFSFLLAFLKEALNIKNELNVTHPSMNK